MHQRGAEAKRKQNQVKKWVLSIAISASCTCDVQLYVHIAYIVCTLIVCLWCCFEMLSLERVRVNLLFRPFVQINALLYCDISPSPSVFVSALHMMKQMDVVPAHRVKTRKFQIGCNWVSQARSNQVMRIRAGRSQVITTTKNSSGSS